MDDLHYIFFVYDGILFHGPREDQPHSMWYPGHGWLDCKQEDPEPWKGVEVTYTEASHVMWGIEYPTSTVRIAVKHPLLMGDDSNPLQG